MDYETMDWDAEARRVGRAFGLVGRFAFIEVAQDAVQLKRPMSCFAVGWFGLTTPQTRRWSNARYEVPTEDGLFISVSYSLDGNGINRFFSIGNFQVQSVVWIRISARITQCSQTPYLNQYAPQIAKALYHLDLLSPEVETALKLSVSAHQKLEWTLEYETRYGL